MRALYHYAGRDHRTRWDYDTHIGEVALHYVHIGEATETSRSFVPRDYHYDNYYCARATDAYFNTILYAWYTCTYARSCTRIREQIPISGTV